MQNTSEPRTQRSGVSDDIPPLTPLRCVRGSEVFFSFPQGVSKETAYLAYDLGHDAKP